METKVNEVKTHKTTFKSVMGDGEVGKKVPVVEAKLVLIECKREDSILFEFHISHRLTTEISDLIKNPKGKFFKPILISETEKIEVGDWTYDNDNNKIFKFKNDFTLDKDNEFNVKKYGKKRYYKILALSENFSPKDLQAIVDDKMKEGDKILVECEKFRLPISEEAVDYCEAWATGFAYRIKLNSSNHVTLHKLVEKMYTREQMYEFVDQWISNTQRPTRSNFEKWFDKNIN